jgi:hypothetical protein
MDDASSNLFSAVNFTHRHLNFFLLVYSILPRVSSTGSWFFSGLVVHPTPYPVAHFPISSSNSILDRDHPFRNVCPPLPCPRTSRCARVLRRRLPLHRTTFLTSSPSRSIFVVSTGCIFVA